MTKIRAWCPKARRSAIGCGKSRNGVRAEPIKFTDRDDAIVPQYAIQRMWEIIRDRGKLDETIVTTGVGQHQMWAAQYFHFNSPAPLVHLRRPGCDGLRPARRHRAQAANPRKTCIDIDGDGSFLMNIQELATAYCENLPVKVLLLNNQHLGMVVQWEDRFYEEQSRPYLSRRRHGP